LIAAPWLPGLFSPGNGANFNVNYTHSLIDVPAAWLAEHVLDRKGLAVLEARATARTIVLIPAVLVFVVLVVVEVRRLWRVAPPDAVLQTNRALIAASTRTFLVFLVLVSTQVQAWYFSWPLALGVLLGWRDTTARVAIAYSVLFPLVAYVREETSQNPVDPLLVAYAILPLALPAARWLRGRAITVDDQRGRPFEWGSARATTAEGEARIE
jgi:hypothetical protein